MKKLAFITLVLAFAACSSDNDKKLNNTEQKAVETQVEKDQASMDSLEKAIQAKIDAVSDDSLMKVEH